MTTETIVKANHGWPVRVTPVNPHDGTRLETSYGGIVKAGAQQSFHVHSGMDLLIHEMQPGEADFAANMPMAETGDKAETE